jgi:hypothetical protein
MILSSSRISQTQEKRKTNEGVLGSEKRKRKWFFEKMQMEGAPQ